MTHKNPTIEARKVQPDEVETYQRIGGYAYANWSDETEEWVPEPHVLDNLFGVFADGKMVARLVNHQYEQVIRGVWRPASAIGGVATLPENRRQGYVRHLMQATFAEMRAKNQAVSTLYPFSQSFYAKFGYVRTNPIPHVHLECSALSHLVSLNDTAGNGWRYERVPAVEAVEILKDFVFQAAQLSGRDDYNGYMRDPLFDADDCRNQHVVFVKEQSGSGTEQIVAAARYELKGYGNGTNNIHDYHWIDVSARDRLLAFFALHGAGIPHIRLSVPPQINFHSWLSDSANSYEVHLSHIPLMVRVMDVAGVLNGIKVRPHKPQRCLRFKIKDELCPWVGGRFEMTTADGLLSVQRTDEEATIGVTSEGVTALAYGIMPIAEIEHRGWICGLDEETRDQLDTWFPEQRIFNLLGF